MARTGSGKTAAFLIPMIQKLKCHSAKVGVRGLILSPSRELALQTKRFCEDLAKKTDLRIISIVGGEKIEDQFSAMSSNPDILVATPGRLVHLAVEMELNLKTVEYFVLDEADRLFEMGFADQISELIARLPESRQSVLISATLPKALVDFASAGLKNPELIRLDLETKISPDLESFFLSVKSEEKDAALLVLLERILKKDESTIIFASTKHHVEYLGELLSLMHYENCTVYGSMDQEARNNAVASFRSGKCKIMIVTDIASRGIDIPLLDNVINYDFPSKPKLFVHRVGRAARAGRSGRAFSLVTLDELPYLFDLQLFLGRSLILNSNSEIDYKNEVFLGKLPSNLLGEEMEAVQAKFASNNSLQSLKHVMQNAYKLYRKTRNVASPESYKRSKEVGSSFLEMHPLFSSFASSSPEAISILESIKNYKPSQTIFDVIGSEKSIKFQASKSKGSINSAKKPVKDIATDFRDESVYLGYIQKDQIEEKELAIPDRRNFSLVASKAAFDLSADDTDGLRRQKSAMVWDKKKKKFVHQVKEKPKMIKTEDGRLVPSSFKSNLYSNWQKKTHLSLPKVGETELRPKEIAEIERNSSRGSSDSEDEENSKNEKSRKPCKRPAGGKNELLSMEQIRKKRKIVSKRKSVMQNKKRRK